MPKMKLTPRQFEALRYLYATGEWESAYRLHARLDTLNALRDRNLIEARGGVGSIAFPHNNIDWHITDAGRQFMEAQKPDPAEFKELADFWASMPGHLKGNDLFSQYPISGQESDSSAE